ncbi:hypothetical protein TSOC_007966 [Tetrabaena socialis]|uniref:Uncharacterized protein n=1 Tax=Tetrabaena socialis TaxID=47790 RepID=A0A2J7ZZP5_9CHLO|nr:hypothetical protein TSOC_007966 [Tetrabaena socialis]|eukprot:PNH05741.1 hypothetical protein TSOC_007966 [Tetrabaena socialis]
MEESEDAFVQRVCDYLYGKTGGVTLVELRRAGLTIPQHFLKGKGAATWCKRHLKLWDISYVTPIKVTLRE